MNFVEIKVQKLVLKFVSIYS